MSEIICPHCGSPNPIEADNCSICHKSLYEEPSQPFQPAASNELDWLKDYRSFGTEGSFISDESSQSDADADLEPLTGPESEQPFRAESESTPADRAGPQPEASGETDVPEWLARVRARSQEDAVAAGKDLPAPEKESKYKVGEPIKTDWLRDLTGKEEKPAADETSNFPDWLKRISARSQEAKKAKEGVEDKPALPFDETGGMNEQSTFKDLEEEGSAPFVQPEEEPEPAPKSEADLFNLYSQELNSLSVQPPESQEPADTGAAEPPPDLLPPEPEVPKAFEGLPTFITDGLPEEPVSEELEPLEDIEPIPDIDWLDKSYIEKSEPEAPAAEESGGIDWTSNEIQTPAPQPWDALANLERLQAESEEPIVPSPGALTNLQRLMSEDQEPVEEKEDALADLDWMKAQGEKPVRPFAETQAAPDWLAPSEGEPAEPVEDPLETLQRLMAEGQEPVVPGQDALAGMDWLKDRSEEPIQPFEDTLAAPDRSARPKNEPVEPLFAAEPEEPAKPGEMPEWMFTEEKPQSPAETSSGLSEPTPAASFEPGEEFSIYDEESLPDWLKEETPAAPLDIPAAAAPSREKPEVPDWLKDLSPSGSDGQTKTAYVPEEHIEESGPLAGFQGILPGEETVTHYTKPPAYAGTLQVTEKQRIYATMFDTIISSEKKAEVAAEKKLGSSSQVLRLFSGILMIGIVLIALFFNAQIAAPPALYPGENVAFFDTLQSITNTTASSRILVGLDYEPSLSGELGTISGAVLQDLMAGNSSLAFVSLNPTGPALAEDLVSRANKTVPDYLANDKVVNLGYLPGGGLALAGLASSPATTAPVTTGGTAAWESGPLQGITSLKDFDAVLLLTDNTESARAWIEQVQTSAKDTPFLVVSSAQAVPALQPYVHSGQITGLLGGLSGAAAYQQLSQATSGSLSGYWDAYQVGMLLTAVFMILGAVVFGTLQLIGKFKKA